MTWSENPKIHVLATAPMPTIRRGRAADLDLRAARCSAAQPFRAFVWMQGHTYANFADPKVQPMLLRGIAWAAKAPIDALMTVQPARGGGGGGGGAAAARADEAGAPGPAAA